MSTHPPDEPWRPAYIRRHCNKCGQDKLRSEFYEEKKRPGILSSRCKACDRKRSAKWNRDNPERHSENQRRYTRGAAEYQRNYLLQKKFHITHTEYLNLLEKQGGGCAICKTKVPGGRGKYFHVDHDRSCCSGNDSCGACVRGLLCHGCNTGLGLFQDDQKVLAAAIEYLK